MLIDYVVAGLQVILIGLIVFGGVLCLRERANHDRDVEADDAQSPLRTDRRLLSNNRTAPGTRRPEDLIGKLPM
jgi:hypothetical protein